MNGYRLAEHRVRLEVADETVGGWVEAYLRPFFGDGGMAPTWLVSVAADCAEARLQGVFGETARLGSVASYPELTTRVAQLDGFFAIDQMDPDIREARWWWTVDLSARRIEVAVPANRAETPYVVARTVRGLLISLARASGWTLLHASCTSTPAGGLLVLGDKGAGKTATMLAALTNPGGGYVANDRVLVRQFGDKVQAVGLPNSPAVRLGALRALGIATTGSTYPYASRGDKVRFLVHELCSHLGVPAVGSALVTRVALPRYGDDLVVRPASSQERDNAVAAAELDRTCDFQPAWDLMFPSTLSRTHWASLVPFVVLGYSDDTLASQVATL